MPDPRPEVVMYSTDYCGYCRSAKRFLEQHKGTKVTEIDVTGDPVARQQLVERTSRTTVPQIFIGDVHVGGYDDLRRLDAQGRLDPLLRGEAPVGG